jgi:hypothetical protein
MKRMIFLVFVVFAVFSMTGCSPSLRNIKQNNSPDKTVLFVNDKRYNVMVEIKEDKGLSGWFSSNPVVVGFYFYGAGSKDCHLALGKYWAIYSFENGERCSDRFEVTSAQYWDDKIKEYYNNNVHVSYDWKYWRHHSSRPCPRPYYR